MTSVTPTDRCPGILRPHQAADGAMIRVRIPGGQTSGVALAELARIAHRYGSGPLQLTARGSIQLRGLPALPPVVVAAELADAGFLPSADHERVRNIAASPLTGLTGGAADLRPMIAALDQALLGEPELAELSGRFLFVLDDGHGDVSSLAVDLGYRALTEDRGVLLVGHGDHGVPVSAGRAIPTMIELAHRFLVRHRASGAWHVRQLDPPLIIAPPAPALAPGLGTPLGRIGDHASVAVPLGLLSPHQVQSVITVNGPGPLVITPWRGLVLPNAAAGLPELVAAGLVADDASAWSMISACVGAPWCHQSRADTRTLAVQLAARTETLPRTHLSGCERRCGAPAGDHLDLVAPTPMEMDEAIAGVLGHA
jgi:precorrin-3B synthase